MSAEATLAEKPQAVQPVAPEVRTYKLDKYDVTEAIFQIKSIRVSRALSGARGGIDWAEAFVREWQYNNGDRKAYAARLVIDSDYGCFAYTWGHMGCLWKDFCQDLGYDYFMTKAHHSRGKTFDPIATLNNWKKQVLKERRSGHIDREDASALMEQLKEIDAEELTTEAHFCSMIGPGKVYDYLVEGAFELSYKRDPQCDAFWKHIWPLLTKAWKDNT